MDKQTRLKIPIIILALTAGAIAVSGAYGQQKNEIIGRIAIGNPKTVPAGQYAQDSLAALELWDKLLPLLIPAENARQVLDYISRDEVDAGFVYASDAAIAEGKIKVVVETPKGSHEAIIYPIAVFKDSANSAAAKKYIELTQSKTGRDILAKYRFAPQAK